MRLLAGAVLLGLLGFGETALAERAAAVLVVSAPWGASYSPEDLADAVRLRLPEASVAVANRDPEAPGVFVVRFAEGEGGGLRVDRDGVTLLQLRLDAEPPEDARRRAALLVAMVAGQAPEPEPRPAAPAETPPPGPAAEPPAVTPAPPNAPRPTESWSVSAAVGPAVAIDSAQLAAALIVRARWVFGAAALTAGAKLSGVYSAASQSVEATVSDRAIWLGGSYRPWGSALGVDLGLAAQYTQPFLDVDGDVDGDGDGGASVDDASQTSRFGVRFSVDALWSPHPNFGLTLGAATTVSFAEREFNRDGRDFLELGATMLDLLAGAEVRW